MRRMVRRALWAAAILLVVWFLFARERTDIPAGPGFMARVVGVADGDTITVLEGRRSTRVRLFGIDCPESHQAFGRKAKEFTSAHVYNRFVRVEPRDTDRYGRTVALVWAERQSLNEQLVRAGLAWAYRHYSEEFVPLEETARRARQGLWADRDPVPPWDYRREGR